MRIVKCKNGHFFDAYKHITCPHCGETSESNSSSYRKEIYDCLTENKTEGANEMENIITIRGTAKATVKPDWAILSLSIDGEAKVYAEAVKVVNEKISKLTNNLVSAGFEKETVKTKRYNVNPQYKFYNDRKGRSQKEFTGYLCRHDINIEFAYTPEAIGKALSTVENSFSNPQLDIMFTIKDKEAVSDMLIELATKNARNRAEIICKAAGASLGKLINVNYNWNEINIPMQRPYMQGQTMSSFGINDVEGIIAPETNIQPDDINVSDSATFVWEIV